MEEAEGENLVDGLQREQKRVRELVTRCESIGPAGAFGKACLERALAASEEALASGDVVAMVRAYTDLQACK
jgi:hypothetical protein